MAETIMAPPLCSEFAATYRSSVLSITSTSTVNRSYRYWEDIINNKDAQ